MTSQRLPYQELAISLQREFPGCVVKVQLYEEGGAVFVHPVGRPAAVRLGVWRPDGQKVDARSLDEAVAELKGATA